MNSTLTQDAISTAAGPDWRLLLDDLHSVILVDNLDNGLDAARQIVEAVGPEDESTLRLDLRPDRLLLTVTAPAAREIGERELEVAAKVSAKVTDIGVRLRPDLVAPRCLQTLTLGIDTMDRSRIRPFWKAVLGYVDEPGDEWFNDLVDPLGQGPTIWFQRMDEPRPQRNRIHFDVIVPHDQAESRIAAALAAGGTLLSDKAAPAFWVLADPDGNEACVCTWQGQD